MQPEFLNSVLSKMMPVWSRYLKRFKSYSIFKCWSSEIQDGGRRPKWRNYRRHLADRFILSIGIFLPKGMFVAFVVSSQYISLQPDRHTYIRR
jgi:hypothetical protein